MRLSTIPLRHICEVFDAIMSDKDYGSVSDFVCNGYIPIQYPYSAYIPEGLPVLFMRESCPQNSATACPTRWFPVVHSEVFLDCVRGICVAACVNAGGNGG